MNEALCIGISSVPGHLYHLPALLSCIRGVSVQYRMSSWRLVTNRVDTDSGNLRPALTVWSEIWSLIQILCGISQFLRFRNISIDSMTQIPTYLPTHKVNSSHFCGLSAFFGQRQVNISWPLLLDTERVLVDKVLTKGLSLSYQFNRILVFPFQLQHALLNRASIRQPQNIIWCLLDIAWRQVEHQKSKCNKFENHVTVSFCRGLVV